MADNKIPERSEIDVENTWRIEDIYASDDLWFEEYEALKALPETITSFSGRLGTAEGLLEYCKMDDSVSIRLGKFYSYANCRSDEDTANSKYQDMLGKAMSVYVDIDSANSFAVPEILAVSDEDMKKMFADEPDLEIYRRPISKIRRKKAHTLSSECERLLAMSGEMSQSPESIGSIFRNADLTFPDALDRDGIAHQVTNGSLVPLLESCDRVLRKNAFEAFFGRMNEFRNTSSAILDAQFKQLKYYSAARKYNSTLEAALDSTEVPVEVYHNLIEAVHNNMDKMYRYVALRKKILGVDELHMYDVYTPLVADVAIGIPFEKAKETALDALAVLGEDYLAVLKEGFNNRWIDVYENKGKRSGAYSTGGAEPHPFVLMNYKNNLDSQFTLVHEMGHSLHSYYSHLSQPTCTAGYVIFVAEVASTCNEILLMRHLLKTTTDKKQRAYLINHFLDSFKGNVYRQTMFAEFELMMGKMCEEGQTLTADVLCEKYKTLNELYFGPDMNSDQGISLEWSRIPHFFYDYYVFQYSTGFCAAVAIANRIREEGAPAVADFKKFLSSGGSSDPISLLKIAGVDMSIPDPVNSGIKLFGDLVDEMEACL